MLELLKHELVQVLAVMSVMHEADPDASEWDGMRAQVEHLQHMIAAIELSEGLDRKLH